MNEQQNKFYSSIAEYYHDIFPYNPAQLQFVDRISGGLAGKKILDIGCATGELAFHLAKAGAEVTGIDLNRVLLNQAKSTKNHPGLTFREGNMVELADDFPSGYFDAVLCFGNTLVHLPDTGLMEKMLKGVGFVLKPGGSFMLQILNYDYILGEKIMELPVIETANIRFVRRYKIKENDPYIKFNTQLYIKANDRIIENETELFALQSEPLMKLLENAGFREMKFYSGFKGDAFGGKHLPLVAQARKSG